MLELNESNFDARIARGTVVVDFYGEWCPPCRVLAPMFERASAAMGAQATFAKANADENFGLLQRYGIASVPTVVVFRDGQPVHAIRGLRGEKDFLTELRSAVGGAVAAAAR